MLSYLRALGFGFPMSQSTESKVRLTTVEDREKSTTFTKEIITKKTTKYTTDFFKGAYNFHLPTGV